MSNLYLKENVNLLYTRLCAVLAPLPGLERDGEVGGVTCSDPGFDENKLLLSSISSCTPRPRARPLARPPPTMLLIMQNSYVFLKHGKQNNVECVLRRKRVTRLTHARASKGYPSSRACTRTRPRHALERVPALTLNVRREI